MATTKDKSAPITQLPAQTEAQQTGREIGIPFDENIIASIVINGDISRLSPDQKVSYYRQFCERLGLDPISQPFKLLKLNGKELLYCDRSGTQQLNKLHKVSHAIRARETVSGIYVVTTQASLPDGRHTESIGAVPIENLRGESLANAMMKAETKSKRRSTLDLLGLGILDESETDTITNAVKLDGLNLPTGASGQQTPPPPPPAGSNPAMDELFNENNGGKPAEQPKALVSPFKRKYDSTAEIDAVLEMAGDVKDIANLYYINAEIIEATPDLKKAFTEKKNAFYNGGQQAQSAA